MTIQQETPMLFQLDNKTAITVQGEHVEQFLQGQLSCDIRQVSATQIRQGALCNLKGRILALLDIVYWEQFHLVLPQNLITETLASLEKVAILSKITFEKSNHRIFGLYVPKDTTSPLALPTGILQFITNADYACYALDDECYVLITKPSFIQTLPLSNPLFWHALQLSRKRIEIYPSTRGLFLPHRLGLQYSEYLSFNKGCYRGQEIIARMHYRSKIKHKLAIFTIKTQEAIAVGCTIHTVDTNTEIGELVDYVPLDEGQYRIAVSILIEHPSKVLLAGHRCAVLLEE